MDFADLVKLSDIYLQATSALDVRPELRLDSSSICFDHDRVATSLATINNPYLSIDYEGYTSAVGELLIVTKEIQDLIDRGNDYIHSLYSYRSLSNAIPDADLSMLKNDVKAYNKAVLSLLSPKVQSMERCMSYVDKSIDSLVSYFKFLIIKDDTKKRHCIPIGHYDYLMTLLDTLVKIDHINDVKVAWRIDYIRFRSVLIYADKVTDLSIFQMYHKLETFLGLKDEDDSVDEPYPSISDLSRLPRFHSLTKLRDKLYKIDGMLKLLGTMVDHTIEQLNMLLYIMPNEKFKYIRSMVYLLFLLDGLPTATGGSAIFSIFENITTKDTKSKAKNLPPIVLDYASIDAILKDANVIPFYNDISLDLISILRNATTYETLPSMLKSKIFEVNVDIETRDKVEDTKYDLLAQWETTKNEYTDYMLRFTIFMNTMKAVTFKKEVNEETVNHADSFRNFLVEGYQCLSKWKCLIGQNMTLKYVAPASTLRGTGKTKLDAIDALEQVDHDHDEENKYKSYDLAVRSNYSPEELSCMLDIIFMIKSLTNTILQKEALYAPFIRFHCHRNVQILVQGVFLPLLHRLDKRNKKDMLSTMLDIRSTAVDWMNGVDGGQQEDYKTYTRKLGAVTPKHTPRVVSSNATQLHILRSCVKYLCSDNSDFKKTAGSVMDKVDLEAEDIIELEKFYHNSYYYPYILASRETLNNLHDLHELWCREYYIDLCSVVQFPIDLSIPWMLIDHAYNSCYDSINGSDEFDCNKDYTPLLEKIFYVIDVYNDSCRYALYQNKMQHLFNELESECGLVVDQIVYLLSDLIYTYYRHLSASELLDLSYKNELEELKGFPYLKVDIGKRFNVILNQRSIQVLGRTIDLNYLMTQQMNGKFRNDIELALNRFESSDATGIIPLSQLLQVIQKTHRYLHQYLNGLESYEQMFNEINAYFAPTSFRSRISSHMIKSLLGDIFPNYSYNGYTKRFVRSAVEIRPIKYKAAPKSTKISGLFGSVFFKVYELSRKLTRDFFGSCHMMAYIDVIGIESISVLMEAVVGHLSECISKTRIYISILKDKLPPINFPKFEYHAAGCYVYFEDRLSVLLDFDDLKPEIFQIFREIGNAIAFSKDLSEALDVYDQQLYLNAAPFLGINPFSPGDQLNNPVDYIDEKSQLYPTPLTQICHTLSVVASMNIDAKMLKSKASTIQLEEMCGSLVKSLIRATNIESKSLFIGIIAKVKELMVRYNLLNEWAIDTKTYVDHPASAAFDSSNAFHRIWSALTFVFNLQDNEENALFEENKGYSPEEDDLPPPDEDATERVSDENREKKNKNSDLFLSDMEEFGHGYIIAGVLFIHLLEQRHLYESFDYSNFIIDVDNSDKKSKDAIVEEAFGLPDENLQAETNRFIKAAHEFNNIHKLFLNIFETQFPTRKRTAGRRTSAPNIDAASLLHPPKLNI